MLPRPVRTTAPCGNLEAVSVAAESCGPSGSRDSISFQKPESFGGRWSLGPSVSAGPRPVQAAEHSAGRRGGQLGEHRGLPFKRLLVAVGRARTDDRLALGTERDSIIGISRAVAAARSLLTQYAPAGFSRAADRSSPNARRFTFCVACESWFLERQLSQWCRSW
jgi:hypothetical protein